jgi:hypothetical protein
VSTLNQIILYKGEELWANYPVNNGHMVVSSSLPYEVKLLLYKFASGKTRVNTFGEYKWGWKT